VQNPAPTGVTQLLVNWSNGDKAALDEMLPLVYQELRRIAVNRLRQELPNHTLQPTALVNEAYLRLVDQKNVDWQNRAQFFGLAAEMMRRILVNHALHRRAAKRGGGALRVSLEVAVNSFEQKDVNLVALDEALKNLAVDRSSTMQDCGNEVFWRANSGRNSRGVASIVRHHRTRLENGARVVAP
jgi:RNA polymerase sigma factor (TIGR02999 family)